MSICSRERLAQARLYGRTPTVCETCTSTSLKLAGIPNTVRATVIGSERNPPHYFRDPAYLSTLPAAQRAKFVDDTAAAKTKLLALKEQIRHASHDGKLKYAPRENYADPKALAELVRKRSGRGHRSAVPRGVGIGHVDARSGRARGVGA